MNEAASELLADANDIVREQLALAWREHVERVRDVLEAQWPERMERAHRRNHRGHGGAPRSRVSGRSRIAAAIERLAERTARRDLVQKLNQAARRLRHFESEVQWSHTLADSTRGFCGRAAVFSVHERQLHLEASRNLRRTPTWPTAVPLETRSGVSAAIETRDTLVALRTRGELSETLANFLGETSEKCCLVPLVTRQGVAAVLYADSGDWMLTPWSFWLAWRAR